MNRNALFALDNAAMIAMAKAQGMTVHPEDYFINYAEIDYELTRREDLMVSKVHEAFRPVLRDWLQRIADPEDVDQADLKLSAVLEMFIVEHIKSVWQYGTQTAEQELQDTGFSTNAASKPVKDSVLTDDDAFEWYELYARGLAQSGQEALFIKMQPLILEALDKGATRLELADRLTEEFARFGSVRADIIARTESNKAFNWGRRYRFDKSPSIAGYRYSSILDGRTTDICKELHDHSWPIGDPQLDLYTPPNHFRCRGVLVPINKYKDWTFNPPAAGWENKLPAKEQTVLTKFKDAQWYPKAATVRKMDPPKPEVKKPVNPKKKKEPAAPETKVPAAPMYSEFTLKMMAKNKEIMLPRVKEFIKDNEELFLSEPDHVAAISSKMVLQRIESGELDRIFFTVEYNINSGKYELEEYERLKNTEIFWREKKGVLTDEKLDGILKIFEGVADDQLFRGIKLDIYDGNVSGNALASYNSTTDVLSFGTKTKGAITTYHEIGHRVHNNEAVYKNTPFADLLHAEGITMSAEKWEAWKEHTEAFWRKEMTHVGEKILPEDMFQRWNYPINAPFYYKNGTKSNFHKEMFAESVSVYLENDAAEVAKVRRTYPGLLEFVEEVLKRGNIGQ